MTTSYLSAFVLVLSLSRCDVSLASGGCLWGVEQTCKDLWHDIAVDIKCMSATNFASNKASCCERMAKARTCFASNPSKNKPESMCTLGMHVQTIGYTSKTLYNLKPVPNHLSTCGCCPEFKCEIAWHAARKELAGCTKAGVFVTTTTTTVYDVTGACLKSHMPTKLACFTEGPSFAFDLEKICRQKECWTAAAKLFKEVQQGTCFMNGADVKTQIAKVRCPQCYYSQGIDKCPSSEKYLSLPTKTCGDRQKSMACPKGTTALENADTINGTDHDTCCKWASCDTYACNIKHPRSEKNHMSGFGLCNKAYPETIRRPDEALGAKTSQIKEYCCESGNCKPENVPAPDPTVDSSTAGPNAPDPTADSSTAVPNAPAPAPAPTPSLVHTVSGVWVIAMENASKLLNNTEALDAFTKSLKKSIVLLLDMDLIKEDHVDLDIAQGSGGSRRLSSNGVSALKVSYAITVPRGAEATVVATKINSKSTDELQTVVNAALIETVKTVPNMQGLTSSGVSIHTQGAVSTRDSVPVPSASVHATAHRAVIMSASLLCAVTSLMANK